MDPNKIRTQNKETQVLKSFIPTDPNERYTTKIDDTKYNATEKKRCP